MKEDPRRSLCMALLCNLSSQTPCWPHNRYFACNNSYEHFQEILTRIGEKTWVMILRILSWTNLAFTLVSMFTFALFSLVKSAAAAKPLQSCPTLCDPIDGSSPGSAVPGILQARTLECTAISFSNAWKWKLKVKSLSHVWPSATPWAAAYQAPLSMEFSRQEYWSGVPLPSVLVKSGRE